MRSLFFTDLNKKIKTMKEIKIWLENRYGEQLLHANIDFIAEVINDYVTENVVKNNAVLPHVSERACNNCRNLMVNKTAQYIHQKYWCAQTSELTLTNTRYVCDNWEAEHVR